MRIGETEEQDGLRCEAAADGGAENEKKLALGIDIGTTTLSAAVVQLDGGRSAAVRTVETGPFLPSDRPWEKMQDADRILTQVKELLSSLILRFPGIEAIGFSGQMHGILYCTEDGRACSPLYTWQDGRAEADGLCEEIRRKTGWQVASGYGLATHLYNVRHGLVPPEAARLCTVMDYAAAAVCGLSVPVMHASDAASIGFYDRTAGRFDEEAIRSLGMDPSLLPPVVEDFSVIGSFGGIPVAVAIGDNQAGFLGSVRDPGTTALANFGTGSQISVYADRDDGVPRMSDGASVEVRPFCGKTVLYSGSALCGGRAYAILELFFRACLAAAGYDAGEQYETLNALAAKGLAEGNALAVTTAFSGTRDDPDARGSVEGISEEDFTPSALAAGFLIGMAKELRALYEKMPHEGLTALVASGNAVRRNPALRTALATVFGAKVLIPESMEEAAYGAALAAASVAGYPPETLRRQIRYLPG
jgi:sedoheptulokinase